MGKLLKQSFWSTIIIYIGVILGFINSIILFPKFLSTEQIGLVRQILSASIMLVPLTTFGTSAAYLKFYPKFKENNDQKNQLLTLQLMIIILSCFVTCSIIFLSVDYIKFYINDNSKLLFQYFHLLYFLVIIFSLSSIFEAYLKSRYEIILNNYVNGVSNRFLTGIFLIFFSLNIIDFNFFLNLQILIYLFGLIILIIYSQKKEKIVLVLNIRKIRKSIKKILNFCSFSFLGNFSHILVLNIDILMVTSILGLSDTGIYTTAFYIGMIIDIPRRAISQISLPFISENIQKKNFKIIEDNYREISINQMMIGILLFNLIIVNLDNIYDLMPNSEKFISGKSVVGIIALSKLIIMSFSYNSEIISLSKYYRFTVLLIMILAIFTIGLNLILIPKYGMIGAAYSSLFAVLIFNIIKFIFLKIKMDISPFNYKTLLLAIIGILIYILTVFIPNFKNPIIDIMINSFIISIIYLCLIIKLKLSPKFNSIFYNLIRLNR